MGDLGSFPPAKLEAGLTPFEEECFVWAGWPDLGITKGELRLGVRFQIGEHICNIDEPGLEIYEQSLFPPRRESLSYPYFGGKAESRRTGILILWKAAVCEAPASALGYADRLVRADLLRLVGRTRTRSGSVCAVLANDLAVYFDACLVCSCANELQQVRNFRIHNFCKWF